MRFMMISAISAALIAGAASAAPTDHAKPNEVRFTAAQLDTSGGLTAVYDRIAEVSARYCADMAGLNFYTVSKQRRCEAQTRAELIAKIGDSRLAAMEATKHAKN